MSNIPHSWINLGSEKLELNSDIHSYPYRFEKPAHFIFQKKKDPLTEGKVSVGLCQMKLNEVYCRRNGEGTGYDEDWEHKELADLTVDLQLSSSQIIDQWEKFRQELDMDKAIAGTEKPDPLWRRLFLGIWIDAKGKVYFRGEKVINSDDEDL